MCGRLTRQRINEYLVVMDGPKDHESYEGDDVGPIEDLRNIHFMGLHLPGTSFCY